MGGADDVTAVIPARVYCDTSYFYACADTDDRNHRAALVLADGAVRSGTQLWATWDVISETVTLLRYRHSAAAAIRFLDDVKPDLNVMDYGGAIRLQAEQVFRRHGVDQRLSLCDAISFVVVTTLLDRMPCFAFDDDFRRLGLTIIARPY